MWAKLCKFFIKNEQEIGLQQNKSTETDAFSVNAEQVLYWSEYYPNQVYIKTMQSVNFENMKEFDILWFNKCYDHKLFDIFCELINVMIISYIPIISNTEW